MKKNLLLLIFSLIASAGFAQVPRLDEIPGDLATGVRAQFEQRLSALNSRRDLLRTATQQHNARCSQVREGTSTEAQCRAEQSKLQAEIGEYSAAVRAFNSDLGNARREQSPVAQPSAGKPVTYSELQVKVAATQAELRGLQEALRRLQQSHLNTVAERTAWNHEMVDAGNRAAWHMLDMTTAGLIEHVQSQHSEIQSELSEAASKLAGETDPDRRAQLHSAISMMERRKAELTPVFERVQKESLVFDVAKLAKSWNDGDSLYRIALDQAHANLGKLLKDPDLVHKLESLTGSSTTTAFAKGAAAWLSVGKDVLDSGYDLSCSLVALHQMNTSLTGEDVEYKRTVDLLKVRMEKAVSSLNAYQQQMQRSSLRTPPPAGKNAGSGTANSASDRQQPR